MYKMKLPPIQLVLVSICFSLFSFGAKAQGTDEESGQVTTGRVVPIAMPSTQSVKTIAPAPKSTDKKSPSAVVVKEGHADLNPSQFQIFVEQNTGKLLPIYGSSLFSRPQLYSEDPSSIPPPDHILSAGDEVSLQIWGAVEYIGMHKIDRYGQIKLPKIGTVTLQGVRVKDLEASLKKQIAKVYSANEVTVTATVDQVRGATVYVVGHARQPGTYNVSSLSTLLNVLFLSGGPNAQGTMRDIRLIRAGKTMTSLDVYQLIAKGDKSKDVSILSGDIIMIPPVGAQVAMVGPYDYEAVYEIKKDETVRDLFSFGSGLPALVSTSKAVLERLETGEKTARKVSNLSLNENGLNQKLRDADILTLLPISPAFSNAVTLQGYVAQQIRHPWTQGMRISDLIPEREALISPDYYLSKNRLVQNSTTKKVNFPSTVVDRGTLNYNVINWNYAVIERFDAKKLKTELIPFNLSAAILEKNPAQNLELMSGDVVTIFSSADLAQPQSQTSRVIRIEGEVNAPGIYQFNPGETLKQFLQRVTGLTPQAYVFGADFTRESVRKQQQGNLDKVIQLLENQQRTISEKTIASNVSADRLDQSRTQLEQQKSNLQNRIERMKSLQSRGRISLEIDPMDAVSSKEKSSLFPDLPLENGDTLSIPSLPGFISVAGQVNNENSLIYKDGITVGDVLKRAGVLDGGDADNVFVLRADGSVYDKRTTGFFRGVSGLKLMPGDTVVVPPTSDRESWYSSFIRGVKDWSQILLNFGLGAAAVKTLSN